MLEQEDYRVERLILRGRTHIVLLRKMAQEILYLECAHRLRVLFIVKVDEATGPVDVSFLGTIGIMPQTQLSAHGFDRICLGDDGRQGIVCAAAGCNTK